MNGARQWFSTMTLGQARTYLRLLRWCLLDSFVASIPYAVMAAAVYFLQIGRAHV